MLEFGIGTESEMKKNIVRYIKYDMIECTNAGMENWKHSLWYEWKRYRIWNFPFPYILDPGYKRYNQRLLRGIRARNLMYDS